MLENRFLLMCLGSAGDVFPFIGIAKELRSMGHEVHFATNEHFRKPVEDVGASFVQLGTVQSYEETINDPRVFSPFYGPVILLRKILLPAMEPSFHEIERLSRKGGLKLVCSSFIFGARVAHDVLKVPLCQLYTAPYGIPSVVDPSYSLGVDGYLIRKNHPLWWRKMMNWSLSKVTDNLLSDVNKFRIEKGLPNRSNLVDDWLPSPVRNIGLWPDWFCESKENWPSNFTTSDFVDFDEFTNNTSDDIEKVIKDRPIVFTLGTGFRGGEEFYQKAIGVCQNLKQPGIIIAPGQMPESELPKNIFWTSDFLPLGKILPKAIAIVHAGGIGTIARCMKQGVPQVVVPIAFDQMDNGMRVKKLGMGEVLPFRKVNVRKLEEALKTLGGTSKGNFGARGKSPVELILSS
jgi:rhamnosyltransferase subunit B